MFSFRRRPLSSVSRKRSPKVVVLLLLLTLLLLPIVYSLITRPNQGTAAPLNATEDSTSITITSPGKYRAVIQKGDTTDYILFYDLAEDAGNPDPTHEFKGPCVLETNTYCLRDDSNRMTTLIEVTDTVVKVRVMGRFNNEASTDYLDDDTPLYFPEVIENYAFTRDGVSVMNRTDFATGTGVTFDADSGHNGYDWLGVYSDVTDGAYDDTANNNYGDGATEAQISADGEFSNTNSYFHMPGTGSSTYQDAFVGIHRDGWYSDLNSSGVHEWNWDEAESGTQDLITAQEQNYNSSRRHEAKWYFLLKSESDLDTEAEREALNNEMINADILSYTVGETSYEMPVTATAINFDADTDYVNVPDNSAYDFGDTADYSVEAWMMRNGNPISGDNPIVSKRLCCGASGWEFQIRLSSARMRLQMTDGTDTYDLEGSTVLSDQTWYHVAAVFDQDNASNSIIYINGVAETMTRTGTIGNLGSMASTAGLGFGVGEPGIGNYNSFSGRIAEVRIWDDVRTAAEIRENMFRQIDPASANLVGYWKLDEGTGTAVHDSSATGANGTIVGGATWDSVNERKADHFNEFEFAHTLQSTAQNAQYDIDAGASNVSTTANGAISDNATTVTVTSTTGFASSGIAYIDGDKFSYTGTTATTFTGVPSSGEHSVIAHVTGSVVAQFTRSNTNFKVGGYQSTEKPAQITKEGISQKEGVDFSASVKPVTDGYFAQDLSFYADFASTTVDVGSNLTNSGCTLTQGGNDYTLGFITVCDGGSDDMTFTSTGNIDYAKGALEFSIAAFSTSADSTERTYFRITDGTDEFRFRKTSGNTLEFLIDEGASTYTESISSANYSWGFLDTVHIRLEWDDSASTTEDEMKIYINGRLPTSTDASGFTGANVSPGTTFRLGNSADSGGTHCNCLIDEFKIYDFNGSGDQVGLAKVGAGGGGGDYFYNPNNNLTLSFAPVDAGNRGEYLYLGADAKVNGYNFDLATNGVGSSLNLDWEYWNGVAWTSLESIVGFTDTTSNLTQSGTVYWTAPPTNWRPYAMNSKNEFYYIRASLNAASGTYTTSPVENRITTTTLYIRSDTTLNLEDQTFVIPTQFQPSVFWKMDEGQGTAINDSTGNKNDGTRLNAVWQTEDMCVSGKCLYFDGSGSPRDYLYRLNDDSFNFTASESFSISIWIKREPISTDPNVILAKHNSSGGGYKIRMENDGDISCGIDDDSTYTPDAEAISTLATYDDNQWHHIECVKDGTSSLSLYIDGILINTNSSISGVGSLVNTQPFYLGNGGDGLSDAFKGFMDEFKMYPYARTADEVKADAIAGAGNRGSSAVLGAQDTAFLNDGLAGYWSLDEGTANSCSGGTNDSCDKSGNNNDGAWQDNATSTRGKFSRGTIYDGTNDNVTITDPTSGTLDFGTGDFTVSTWVNFSAIANGSTLLGKNFTGSGAGYGMRIQTTSPTIWVGDGATTAELAHTAVLSNSAWYHVVGVRKNGTLYIYVNGVQGSSTASFTGNVSTTGNLYLGARGTGATANMAGSLDEVRIYNRALAPAEITTLYNWAPGPVGYWKLDENTGISAYDSSGNASTGTLTNSPTWTPGKFGSGVNLGGNSSNHYVSIADNDLYSPSLFAGATIQAWFNQDTATAARDWIVAKGNTSNFEWGLAVSNGVLYCEIWDSSGSSQAQVVAGVVSTGAWHFASCTMDNTNGVYLYLDGVLQGSSPGLTGGMSNTTSAVQIGNRADGGDNNFDGTIDEVKIYNYVRTPGQMLEDMNGTHPVGGSPVGSQILNWKFDEGNGTTANNEITGGTNGTLTSMATAPSTSSSGWTASGKFNKALVFDGTDDKVVIDTASDANVDFNASEQFSLSAWVYSTTVPTTATDEDLIIGKWDETSSQRAYRVFLENDDTDSTGHIRVEVMDESTGGNEILSAVTSNDTISQNTWYHVTMTFNGTITGAANSLKVYLDGKQLGTNAANASFVGIDDVTSDFTVGDYDATDSDGDLDGFTGRIDTVQVYGAELTADQVKIVMNANSGVNFSTGRVETDQSIDGTPSNIAGYWNLNENTGTTVNDTSGNANALTMSGVSASSWVPAKYGSGLYFDGADDYLSIADDADFDFAAVDSFTISAWAKNSGSLASSQHIFVKGDTTDGGWKLYLNTAGNYCVHFADNINNAPTDSACSSSGGYDYNDNQWHHITAVKVANSELHLYIDGVLVASDTAFSYSGTLANTGSLLVGIGQSTTTEEFTGILDELKISRTPLTASQVAFEYNRGRSLAWWKFDDCTGTTAYNAAQNGNGDAIGSNGTITIGATGSNTSAGSCNVVNTATAWYNGLVGKFNNSIDFDGTDDYVSVADTEILRPEAGSWSVSLWANPANINQNSPLITKRLNSGNFEQWSLYICGNIGCSTDGQQVRFAFVEADGTTDRKALSTLDVVDGNWHHYVGIASKDDDSIILYRDTIELTSTSTTNGSWPTVNNTDPVRIANDNGSVYYNGQIDDVQVFNYTLSQEQVKKLYNEGSSARFGPESGTP